MGKNETFIFLLEEKRVKNIGIHLSEVQRSKIAAENVENVKQKCKLQARKFQF